MSGGCGLWRLRSVFAWMLGAIVFGLSGCPLEEDPPPRSSSRLPRNCQRDANCRTDQICLFEVCNDACAQQSDCRSGATCFDTGRGAVCVRLQDNSCSSEGDCPARSQCKGGRCVTPCEIGTGTECFPGRVCIAGACQVDSALRASAAGSTALTAPLTSFAPISAGAPAADNAAFAGSAGVGALAGAGGARAGASGTAGAFAGASGTGGAALAGASGTGVAAGSAASGAAGASGSSLSSGQLASCPRGSTQCDGMTLIRCDAAGARIIEENCTFLCRDGECTGSCKPGDQRCSANERQSCDARGQWTTTQTCTNVCTANACADACSEGSRQCDGSLSEVCRGGRFVADRMCPYRCAGGACVGQCMPGQRQCSNNALATCDADGSWTEPVPCLNACVDGFCTGVCTPGAQRCAGNSGYQVCGNMGRWGATQTCSEQACVGGSCSGVCSPGSTRCENELALRVCQSDGQWGDVSECAGQACVQGRCSGECVPAQTRCDDNAVRACGPDGSWGPPAACVDQTCMGGSCRGECAPASKRCKPDAPRPQRCGEDGAWQDDSPCASQSCANAECVEPAACESGQSPDWYSPVENGGDPSLRDPRWGSLAPSAFALDSTGHSGGYIIVFDRAAGELAVTMRATLADAEAPDPSDSVYIAIASNRGSTTAARAARLRLIELNPGEGPRALTTLDAEAYAGSWLAANADWLTNAAVWRAAAGDDISWAVSFRVSLTRAEVDPTAAFRLALSLNLNGADALLTPANLDAVHDQPATWPRLVLDSTCIARASLQP